jgi:hypothetical protein
MPFGEVSMMDARRELCRAGGGETETARKRAAPLACLAAPACFGAASTPRALAQPAHNFS